MSKTKKVFKYEFPVDDGVVVELPFLSEILSVGTQRPGHICIWALVGIPANPSKPRRFRVAGTGHPLEGMFTKANFIGTVFNGPFVWHVFEELS